MNVALTRARSSLFVLGDMNKLRSNQYWGNLVADAQARGLLVQVRLDLFHSFLLLVLTFYSYLGRAGNLPLLRTTEPRPSLQPRREQVRRPAYYYRPVRARDADALRILYGCQAQGLGAHDDHEGRRPCEEAQERGRTARRAASGGRPRRPGALDLHQAFQFECGTVGISGSRWASLGSASRGPQTSSEEADVALRPQKGEPARSFVPRASHLTPSFSPASHHRNVRRSSEQKAGPVRPSLFPFPLVPTTSLLLASHFVHF